MNPPETENAVTDQWFSNIDAVNNALYALDPNRGEPVDSNAAWMWLRTTLPENQPDHLTWEYVETTLGWNYARIAP
jgi:hypothetical protein